MRVHTSPQCGEAGLRDWAKTFSAIRQIHYQIARELRTPRQVTSRFYETVACHSVSGVTLEEQKKQSRQLQQTLAETKSAIEILQRVVHGLERRLKESHGNAPASETTVLRMAR